MGARLSLKAALPLAGILATSSDRCIKTGPWSAVEPEEMDHMNPSGSDDIRAFWGVQLIGFVLWCHSGQRGPIGWALRKTQREWSSWVTRNPTYVFTESQIHSLYLSWPWCDAGFPHFLCFFFMTIMHYGYLGIVNMLPCFYFLFRILQM